MLSAVVIKRPSDRPYYRLCAYGISGEVEPSAFLADFQVWEGENPREMHADIWPDFLSRLPETEDRGTITKRWQMWENGEWIDCDPPLKFRSRRTF